MSDVTYCKRNNARLTKASSWLTRRDEVNENDVDGYKFRTKRCFLRKQLKLKALYSSK